MLTRDKLTISAVFCSPFRQLTLPLFLARELDFDHCCVSLVSALVLVTVSSEVLQAYPPWVAVFICLESCSCAGLPGPGEVISRVIILLATGEQ